MLKFFNLLFVRFQQDNCLTWAAGLSYTLLLSLIPLLASSLVFIKAFPVFSGAEEKIQQIIFDHFVAGSAETIQNYVHQFLQQSLKLSGIGSIFLLVIAVLLIFNMEKAFNHIWKAKSHRKGIPAFLMYWGILTLLPLLSAIGFWLNDVLKELPVVLVASGNLKVFFSYVLSFSFTWLAFAFLYVSVPNCKVKIRYALAGGFFAALLFEFAKRGFAFYVAHFPTYKIIYGSLSVIPLFLIWLYIAWVIILLGVEVVSMLQEGDRSMKI